MYCRSVHNFLSILFLFSVSVFADLPRSIVLHERLDRGWEKELLSYPLSFTAGTCRPQQLHLEKDGKPVPFQLSDIVKWPDGSLQSALIWLIADPLSARESRSWQISKSADETAEAPLTDLCIQEREESLELRTSQFAIRLFNGGRKFPDPVPSSEAPAPIQRMFLADDTSFGGSELYGSSRVRAVSAQLTAGGPVFAEVTFRYEYADDNVMKLRARLAAGDNCLLWDTEVEKDSPDDGWRISLHDGLPPLFLPLKIEHFSQRDCVKRDERAVFQHHQPIRNLCVLPLQNHAAGLVTQLTPWDDWWDDYTQVRFSLWMPENHMALCIESRDPGAWIEPGAAGKDRGWGETKPKMIPLKKSEDGSIYLEINLAAGALGGIRRWTLGALPMPEAAVHAERLMDLKDAAVLSAGDAFPRIGRHLDVVNDYVLDWPRDPRLQHPHLYLSQEEIDSYRQRFEPDPDALKQAEQIAAGALRPVPSYIDARALAGWLVTGTDEWVEKAKLRERLQTYLALLGEFDRMRSTTIVAGLYDALIDSKFIAAEDRLYLRAQMAYLAYKLADPGNWSIERGYRSGNPNMSISHLMNQGITAALLRDHPMAEQWAEAPVARLKDWLRKDVGPMGEWGESHHYVHVSADPLMAFVIAAKRAGFHDFFADAEIKKLLLYVAKMVYTPPDPHRGGLRVTAPMGRRPSGVTWALTGFAAKATVDSDPAFSQAMQFIWKGTGFSRNIADAKFAGFERVYPDQDLAAVNPQWRSEHFPWWGAVLRHGFGTDDEHYVNVLAPTGPVFNLPSAPGSVVKFFSRGIPVGGAFAGAYSIYPNIAPRQELLQNRVVPARDWHDVDDFYNPFAMKTVVNNVSLTALPRLDYLQTEFHLTEPAHLWHHVAGKKLPPDLPKWPAVEQRGQPPLDWQRQIIFVKDSNPAALSYLVFRDTVSGDQPTAWQFWTLSEIIGAPQDVQERQKAMAEAPGPVVQPYRQLQGNRFTALGQFGLDVEYFIAAPRDTARYTLRYGYKATAPNPGLEEYQDLLDLRLPGDGHYFVALLPRDAEEKVPEFATLGAGHVIKISGDFGTDYIFVSPEPIATEAEGIFFEGTVAGLQQRQAEHVLSLAAAGSIRHPSGFALASAESAAELRTDGKTAVVEVADTARAHSLTVTFTQEMTLLNAPPLVELQATETGIHHLLIPAGIGRVELSLP